MLYKNLHMVHPNDLISITYKVHGTSGISSYVLCKRKISIGEKIGSFFHNVYTNITTFGKQSFKLETTEYDYLYSSRKVIKNEDLNPNAEHFYGVDIWALANMELKEFLQKGMTFYYEIVGYLPSGAMIQKDYDYGFDSPKDNYHTIGFGTSRDHDNPYYEEGIHYGIFIYRITQTNTDGKVFEFSAKQVQDFCTEKGLKAVPELFYGYAANFSDERLTDEHWQNKFLETIKTLYNEKDCYMCKTKVPEEGAVIRIEKLGFKAYKQKSNRFYERETKALDAGESDIEEEN